MPGQIGAAGAVIVKRDRRDAGVLQSCCKLRIKPANIGRACKRCHGTMDGDDLAETRLLTPHASSPAAADFFAATIVSISHYQFKHRIR
ncbi:MAG TPA: hypothetical protein VGJ01_11390 [Pseudolabrys sp.]|jgi:hypothetical protein